jgi:hypothetical protein
MADHLMNGGDNDMNSHKSYRSANRPLELLLSTLAICATARAQARFEVVTVPAIREHKDASSDH